MVRAPNQKLLWLHVAGKSTAIALSQRETKMASHFDPQPPALNVREVWFSNMHLLGLHPSLCEEKYRIKLEKDMFEHINKKGSEAVLHFLFSRLDPKLSSEVFR